MKSYLALFVLVSVSLAIVSADCPDKVYNCFDEQNYHLGKVCGGTCGNPLFGTCRPCDNYPVVKCQNEVSGRAANAYLTGEKCNEKKWKPQNQG